MLELGPPDSWSSCATLDFNEEGDIEQLLKILESITDKPEKLTRFTVSLKHLIESGDTIKPTQSDVRTLINEISTVLEEKHDYYLKELLCGFIKAMKQCEDEIQ